MTSTLPTDFWGRVIYILQNYSASLGRGVLNTMIIAVLATLAGCIIGLAVGIVQTIPTDRKQSPVRWALLSAVKFILSAYVEIFRGTPMMVQAMFIFYGVSMLTGVVMPYMGAALLIVSINTGAYMAETVRGGILSIDPGQTEGAHAIGMTHVQTMTYVILPQALRTILPSGFNEIISLAKGTAMVYVLAMPELFYTIQMIYNRTQEVIPLLMVGAAWYLAITSVLSAIQYLVERGLARSERRSAVNSARSSRLNQPARQPQPQEAVHAQLS